MAGNKFALVSSAGLVWLTGHFGKHRDKINPSHLQLLNPWKGEAFFIFGWSPKALICVNMLWKLNLFTFQKEGLWGLSSKLY